MLEDGEIDEEDLEVAAVEETQIKPDNNDGSNNDQSNKRKNRETKLNKRKKHAKNPKSSHSRNGHSVPVVSDDECSNNSDNFKQYWRQRASDTNDERPHFNFNNNNGNQTKQPLLGAHPPSLLGLPTQKPKSLMSATPNPSSWSNPQSKKENAPKSLFDLFVTPSGSLGNGPKADNESKFVDPIITEKENSKPAKFQYKQQRTNIANELNKRKSDDESSETGLISIESIEKKMKKKRKYTELHREKLKKQEQQPPKPPREPIICKFFLEGRCQKGTECPFSHNTVLSKKLEPCKFYLNGFCAKNENCLFMHGDFPCKFFHRKSNNPNKTNCIHGDQCRFSHAPITDPLLLEAFNKHVIETSHNNSAAPESTDTSVPINKTTTSILGSPPRTLTPLLAKPDSSVDRPPSLMSLMSVKVTNNEPNAQTMSPLEAQHPSSPPPASESVVNTFIPSHQQNIPFKKTLLATPTNVVPSLLNNSMLPSAFGGGSISKDVDERSVPPPKLESKIPLLSTPPPNIIESNDIDERSMLQQIKSTSNNQIIKQEPIITNKEPIDNSKTESLKQELIIKIMKAIADSDSGNDNDALSKLPKQTLTELLVKLLNDKDNLLGSEVILNLLSTLGGSSGSSTSKVKTEPAASDNDIRGFHAPPIDDDDRSTLRDSFNESSSNLQIDLNMGTPKKRTKNGSRRRDDDPYSDYEDEYDQDEDDDGNNLVIEGTLNEDMDYKVALLEVEPSSLWTDPPVASESSNLNLTGLTDQQDQECDPRIKYYQDRSNCMNIANYQKQLIEQNQASLLQLQQQNTPTSPSANNLNVTATGTVQSINNTNIAITEVKIDVDSIQQQTQERQTSSQTKNRIVDPRLKRNLNSMNSPTRSISPVQPELNYSTNKNDLISIQSRQMAGNSLLSQLPDLQFPKDLNRASNSFSATSQQSYYQEPSTVKLSIEDYKRKLQKPTTKASNSSNLANSITSSTMSILNSIATSSSSSTTTDSNSALDNNKNSLLPSIPSYSVNLQAPQSLHELLRNFQSS